MKNTDYTKKQLFYILLSEWYLKTQLFSEMRKSWSVRWRSAAGGVYCFKMATNRKPITR